MKDVAMTCTLRAVNASKYLSGRSSTRDPAGETYSAPQNPNWIWGRGRETKGGRGEGRGERSDPQAKVLAKTLALLSYRSTRIPFQ